MRLAERGGYDLRLSVEMIPRPVSCVFSLVEKGCAHSRLRTNKRRRAVYMLMYTRLALSTDKNSFTQYRAYTQRDSVPKRIVLMITQL